MNCGEEGDLEIQVDGGRVSLEDQDSLHDMKDEVLESF